MLHRAKYIALDRLRQVLDYNPESGVFVWRERPIKTREDKIFASRYAGRPAGCLDPKGYVYIRIDGTLFQAHRLAWLYVHGEWPAFEIDHRDVNPSNNAIANLRAADRSTNGQNKHCQANNKCGLKGVHFDRRLGKFRAEIWVRKRKLYLGVFKTAEAAHAAYGEAARTHHGEFARVQ